MTAARILRELRGSFWRPKIRWEQRPKKPQPRLFCGRLMPLFLWGLLGGPHQGCVPGSGKVLGRAARCCQAQLSRPRGGCGQGAAACWCQGWRNFGVEVQKHARRGAAVCCWSCRAHSGCQSEPNSIEIKCALTELLFMDLQGSTSMQPCRVPKGGQAGSGLTAGSCPHTQLSAGAASSPARAQHPGSREAILQCSRAPTSDFGV